MPHEGAELRLGTHDTAGSIAFRERAAVKMDSRTIQIAARVIFIVRLCHCSIVLLWDCTIVELYYCTIEHFAVLKSPDPTIPHFHNPTISQSHNSTIVQSHNSTMLQWHNLTMKMTRTTIWNDRVNCAIVAL